MNTQEIARHLLNRRNAMNPVIMPGEILSSIGSDAMQEALQKRWLVPSDLGLLQVTPEGSKIQEMRDVSDKCPTCHNAECTCQPGLPVNASHGYAFEHAIRRTGSRSLLQELLSPGTGHENDNGLKTAEPLTPTSPPAPTVPPKPVGTADKTVGVATKDRQGNLQVQLDPKNPATRDVAAKLATA